MADPTLTGLAATLGTVMVGFLGYLGVSRSKKVDAASVLIKAYSDWTDQLRQSEEQCREQLAELRTETAESEARLRSEIEDLRVKHDEEVASLRLELSDALERHDT